MACSTFLAAIAESVGANPTFTWVDADFLIERCPAVRTRTASVPGDRGNTAAFGRFYLTRETAAGMRFRTDSERRAAPKARMSEERERELLAAWHARI